MEADPKNHASFDEKATTHLKEEQWHYIISPGADGAVLCGETGTSAWAAGAGGEVTHGGSATGRGLTTWPDTTNDKMRHSYYCFILSKVTNTQLCCTANTLK